ncbi:hypothetical protein I5Q41_10245 [Pseudomonas monteilii]|jgi:hypothetical protein|uniref:DUF4124 domain-containing protein n=1 Tax=Pseudomonas monteilii TaxID=76759 RepID=A0A3G2HK19_9PSED|nr:MULTISPECIES: hypothetical protein [Pseudomonas]AYN17268.1 hypothetical protein CHR29_19755 [Pseudomonas monteilii]AYN99112.1 hypothetical protein D8767_09105 [Pseudomonas sp. LTGT-11-2Z]KPM63619.1 hypothetical protein HB4184_12550 [Pseudomonas putida]MBA1314340.1 hypothetical protein [Pseudomonas monteilii]MBA6090773.1 hypothetical protein [Pseudomonas monteilii]
MKRLFVAMLVACCLGQLQAAPAPYWRWESLVDGRLVCSQWSPGEGWRRFAGPYNNARCRDLP